MGSGRLFFTIVEVLIPTVETNFLEYTVNACRCRYADTRLCDGPGLFNAPIDQSSIALYSVVVEALVNGGKKIERLDGKDIEDTMPL